MPSSLDRFSVGVTPIEPKEVGTCQGCSGVMFDYDQVYCRSCCAEVHTGCKGECDRCGDPGCRSCLTQNPDTGEWLCENCGVTK